MHHQDFRKFSSILRMLYRNIDSLEQLPLKYIIRSTTFLTRNQIDFMLINKIYRNSVRDVKKKEEMYFLHGAK